MREMKYFVLSYPVIDDYIERRREHAPLGVCSGQRAVKILCKRNLPRPTSRRVSGGACAAASRSDGYERRHDAQTEHYKLVTEDAGECGDFILEWMSRRS